ncbi:hypothetical protein IFM89_017874 [Coptis chinensis]|uniref:Xylanase inhibitor C-terminal domain-containing protein n=1 Tax=Coptis chinensis TaxID=261450 RepID=A0A835IX12_9MAGN|nr:hypothetical protein IFM89_017874 [Coptis chinensis]
MPRDVRFLIREHGYLGVRTDLSMDSSISSFPPLPCHPTPLHRPTCLWSYPIVGATPNESHLSPPWQRPSSFGFPLVADCPLASSWSSLLNTVQSTRLDANNVTSSQEGRQNERMTPNANVSYENAMRNTVTYASNGSGEDVNRRIWRVRSRPNAFSDGAGTSCIRNDRGKEIREQPIGTTVQHEPNSQSSGAQGNGIEIEELNTGVHEIGTDPSIGLQLVLYVPAEIPTPIVYRLHQLNRAAQLVTALSFTVRGAETTSHNLAINRSLGTLLNVLQFLGVICIWSLASFLTRQVKVGILGLGRSSLTFPSQINKPSSYCLVDKDSTRSWTLKFGSIATFNDAITTPSIRNSRIAIFYYIGLTGVSVGGQMLPISPSVFARIATNPSGSGGVLVDSGTVVTRFRPEYVCQGLPTTGRFGLFDTCFDLTSRTTVKVPSVAFSVRISVGGQMLPISPSAFALDKSGDGGVIVDSGTTTPSVQYVA